MKLKVDYENKKIIMGREFAKRAAVVGSKEYLALQLCRKENQGFEIVRRTIKKAKSKQTYKGLSYVFIEKYIASHPDSDIRMSEYKELRLREECRRTKYANIRKWFLKKYPEAVSGEKI